MQTESRATSAMKLWIGGLTLAASLFAATRADAESVTGQSSGGFIYPTYNASGVPLLDSFYFRYIDGDHHIRALAAQPLTDGTIMLGLADTDGDDEYFYSVEHKRRQESRIITGGFVDFCTSTCVYPLTAPPSAGGYVFVLRGFYFFFGGNDHHIDQIGIIKEAAGVRTYFNDKDDNDPYVVYVDYAWVPTGLVEATGSLTGSAEGGVQRPLANANRAVISGFKMDYSQTDRHVWDIGVLTRTSDIEVFYGDSSTGAGDDFAYQVDYTILAVPPVICCASVPGEPPGEDDE
jgi:hypothetical protein